MTGEMCPLGVGAVWSAVIRCEATGTGGSARPGTIQHWLGLAGPMAAFGNAGRTVTDGGKCISMRSSTVTGAAIQCHWQVERVSGGGRCQRSAIDGPLGSGFLRGDFRLLGNGPVDFKIVKKLGQAGCRVDGCGETGMDRRQIDNFAQFIEGCPPYHT